MTAAPTTRRSGGLRAAAKVFLALALLGFAAVACRADAIRQVVFVQQNMIEIPDNQIISWVFRNHSTIASARREFEQLLEARIDLVEQACSLSPEQRTRLLLAGEGDLHRFLNRFETLRRTLPSGRMTQQEYQNLWQKLQPLAQEYALGLDTDDSLFARSLRTTLNFEQLQQYEEFERERNRRHYIGTVKVAIAMIEDEVPLTVAQRKKLFDLIVAQGAPDGGALNTNYRFYVVLYKISKIPEKKLKPIFLENEWKVVLGILQQAQSMKRFFAQQGIDID